MVMLDGGGGRVMIVVVVVVEVRGRKVRDDVVCCY